MAQKSLRATVKRVVVPSRYRSATQERPCDFSIASTGGPSTSSPKNEQKASLDIHDSFVSVIPSKAESSVVSKPVPGLQRCRSMSDIGRTRLNLADSEIKSRSNQVTWTFLLEHSRKAVKKQSKMEETLQKAVAEARDREVWLKRWLELQKSTDLQIAIYRRMLELMEGESGIISLLRRLYDSRLQPINGRLPLEGLTVGDNFQANLEAASRAQEDFVAATTGDLRALSVIAYRLSELARFVHTSTFWVDNKEVVAKLTQACRLCLHLVSLRTHGLQQKMAQQLGLIPSQQSG
ncbi:hypothetical protein TcWFU_001371 [Taenia crassiceps]|uniref:Uncharacterized protein n=1 Tax=Taenia crassiceps TaxID=6207 RepID=A0ABR4Q408_9CEST